jgi:hypothetical protein
MARRIFLFIVTYALWLVSAALALWVMVRLRQFLLIDFPIRVLMPRGLSQYGQRSIDRFGTVILGLLWLVFVVASESYFRRILEGRLSARKVAAVFAIEALLLVFAFGGSRLVA